MSEDNEDLDDELNPAEEDLYSMLNHDHAKIALYHNFTRDLGKIICSAWSADSKIEEIQSRLMGLKYGLGKISDG